MKFVLSLFRWLLFALLLLLLSMAAVFLITGEYFYKQRITAAVEAFTGRPLHIDGAVTLRRLLPPRVSIARVRYPNAAWSSPPAPDMAFEAEAILFTFDPITLLQGDLVISDIELVKPKLWVEKNADGVYNFSLAPREAGQTGNRAPPEWLSASDPRIIDGEITVVTKRRRWDLRIDDARAEMDARDEPVDVEFTGALEDTPVTARATIGSIAELFAQQPSAIMLDGMVGHRDNRVRIDGSVGNLLRWRDADLQLQFSIAYPAKLSGIAGVRVLDIGVVDGRARFRQPGRIFTARLEEIDMGSNHLGLISRLKGEIGKLYAREDYQMSLTLQGPLDLLLPKSFANPADPLQAELRATVHGALRELQFTIEGAHAENDEVAVRIDGALQRINRIWRGSLPLSVTLKKLERMDSATARALSPLLPLRAEGVLARETGDWQLREFNVSAQRDELSLRARGEITRMRRPPEGHFMIDARAAEARLQPLLATAPPHSALAVQAALTFGGGRVDVREIDASLRAPQFDLSARGAVRDIGASMRADLGVSMQLDAAAPLHAWLQKQNAALLENFLPLRASARVYSSGQFDWRVRDVSVSPAKLPPPDARESDDTAKSSLDFTLLPDASAIQNLQLSIDTESFHLRAHGDAAKLRPLQVDRIDVTFNAESVGGLNWRGLGALDPDNPIAFEAQVALDNTDDAPPVFHADITKFNVGESDLRGVVKFRPSRREMPALVRADLQSDNFEYSKIFPKVEKERERFFSVKPLNINWIHGLDARVDLHAARASHRLLGMRDVHAYARVQDGVWDQSLFGAVGDGEAQLEMALTFDAGAQPPEVQFELHGEQLDTAGLLAFREDNYLKGGVFEAGINITARGESPAAIAGSADGSVLLRIDNTRIKNQTIDVFGGDIFSNILTVANPFRTIGDYVDLECAVVDFGLDGGIAATTERMIIKTERMTMRANGSIDLKDESLQLLISPKARKGFGINPSSLLKIVRVGGTLAKPKIETDAFSLLHTGAVFWAALYSGGWSLIAQGLFDRASASIDVCARDDATPE